MPKTYAATFLYNKYGEYEKEIFNRTQGGRYDLSVRR